MLSEEQMQFYKDEGYLILRGLMPLAEAEEYRDDLYRMLAKPWTGSKRLGISYEEKAKNRDPRNPLGASFVMQSPLLGERWFKLTMHPRLVEPIVDLLGPNINLHDQKIPIKPPGHKSHQRWHQDWAYEEHDRPELAAVLLYLDETAPGAGATMLAPKTHHNGPMPHTREDAGRSIPDEMIMGKIEQPSMEVGDAIIIHTQLAHRVGDNATEKTRAMVAHVYKTAEAIDTHGNTRVMAEMPVARNGKPAMTLNY